MKKIGPNYSGMPMAWLRKRVIDDAILATLTHPGSIFPADEAQSLHDRLLAGGRLDFHGWDGRTPLDGALVMWGMDHGLTTDQIEELRNEIFGAESA